ncbi:hypothetical protein OG204_00035 [Streptomyces sp. NBC_01387]|uniref:hypothetical protein n=1 Tax=Streptomyces sp. NBC_01387 TaxID=2903849 RepID=UPI0032436104
MRIRSLAFAAVSVLALAASVAPASAATSSGAALRGQQDGYMSVSAIHGSASPDSWQKSYCGYTGTFKDGSSVLEVHWASGSVECFGVAPSRTIWHVWSGSGGWQEMPGNGRADDTVNAYENTTTGTRTVEMYVSSSNSHWCSSYTPGSGSGWGSWWNCG